MEIPASIEKQLNPEQDVVQYAASSEEGTSQPQDKWAYFKHYFTSREGWIGDYVRPPNI